MIFTRSLILVIVFVVFISGTIVHAQDKSTDIEMVTLKIRVLEQIPGQEAPRIRSQPMMMSLIDRPLWLDVGSTVESKFDQSQHEVGLKFVAHIKKLDSKKYELQLEWFRGGQTQPKEDPDTEFFVQEKLSARTILQSGKPKNLHVSANRWYELTIFGPGDTPKLSSHQTPRPVAIPRTVSGSELTSSQFNK
ncbi:hypothetical protein [Bremerella sp. P1]|uniref:hypothetical protein n=1 Tax=Bremerella sp. P1 TaxID=3026424 RepID=UPI0023676533|nr:hypothetical protein [Bremerella sp. P1]WDI42577.1 hypothetical protein PSR63_01285 [Bremerella sp. P1]